MNNNSMASQTRPAWLKTLMEECEREGAMYVFTGSRMFRQKARNIVWYMCDKLNCRINGVPGQACRIAEWFIVSTIKHLPSGPELVIRKQILNYFQSRMLLVVASSIMIASEINSARLNVNAQAAREVLAVAGFFYQVEDFYSMGLKILSTLELTVSPRSCVELGMMLAHKVAVSETDLFVVATILDLAERNLYDIEATLHFTDYIRLQNGPRMRVRTLHLAAAGVAAAIKYATPPGVAAKRLADMLNLPVAYIECVRDVVLSEITKVKITDPRPLAALHHRMSFNDENDNNPQPQSQNVW